MTHTPEITNVGELASDLKAGVEFAVKVGGEPITFTPVKRCPTTSKDMYGDRNECHGVWYAPDRRSPTIIPYRFCPKPEHIAESLTGLRLWHDIEQQAKWAIQRRQKRNEFVVAERIRDAAPDLLAALSELYEVTLCACGEDICNVCDAQSDAYKVLRQAQGVATT